MLSRPKIRRYVSAEEAAHYLQVITAQAEHWPDPAPTAPRTRDPDDDYLLTLAEESGADSVVSGDGDLLAERSSTLIFSPRQFAQLLWEGPADN